MKNQITRSRNGSGPELPENVDTLPTTKFGIYIGRFNPIHRGHQTVIDAMIANHGIDSSLLVIGSSNAPFSLRHFFSYQERASFIRTLFPELRFAGLPDYPTDSEWLDALDDIIRVAGINVSDVTYYGGCPEDIRFFLDDKRHCYLLNRFDGTSPKISATEVRDALIYGRPMNDYLDARIVENVRSVFREKWEKFKKI